MTSRGPTRGRGSRNIDKTRFRLDALDTWTPERAAGSTGCESAHYLDDRGDGLLAYAFYGQGTRFLDASNPRKIKQVGYYRPNNGDAFAPYWYRGHVFVADFTRGVDILRFKGGSKNVRLSPITAPRVPSDVEFDPDLGYMCPLPKPDAAAGL